MREYDIAYVWNIEDFSSAKISLLNTSIIYSQKPIIWELTYFSQQYSLLFSLS